MSNDRIAVDIVFCDLDHTLVDLGAQTVSTYNRKAIKQLQDEGKTFVVATGRSLERSINIAHSVNAHYGVLSNGGIIYSFLDNRVLHVAAFTQKDVQPFLQQALPTTLFVTIYTIDQDQNFTSFYWGKPNKHFFEQKVDLKHFRSVNSLEDVKGCTIFRINIYGDPNLLSEIASHLDKKVFTILLNYTTVLELTAREVSKGSAATFILKHFHFDKNRAVAFGDGLNDIAMFHSVKYGIAVANANPKLIAIAYAVTESFDQSGVGKALYKWFL